MILLTVWFFCGFIPALIASGKGRSFVGFFIYGLILPPIALIHSLVASSDPNMQTDGRPQKTCPSCLSKIPAAAKKCKHCTADQPPAV